MNDINIKNSVLLNYYKLIDEKKRHYTQTLFTVFTILAIFFVPLFAAIANYYYLAAESVDKPITGLSQGFDIYTLLFALMLVLILSFLIYSAVTLKILINLSLEGNSKLKTLSEYFSLKKLELVDNTFSNFFIISVFNSIFYFFLYLIIIYIPAIRFRFDNILTKISGFDIDIITWYGLKLFLIKLGFGFLIVIIFIFIYQFITYGSFKIKLRNINKVN